MFPVHGAPDDFVRFAPKGLHLLFEDFRILHFENLRNYCSLMCLFLQNTEDFGGWRAESRQRIFVLPLILGLRLIGMIFLILRPFFVLRKYAQ